MAQIVRAAAELSLAEHLADGPRTAAQIAEAQGADPDAIERFLQACASLGLAEYADGGFAGTELLAVLHGDNPVSLKDFAVAMSSGGMWKTWARLPEAVQSGESQSEEALGMPIFAWLAANPDEGARFGAAMTSLSTPVIRDAVEVIDVAGVTTVVDVGGAHGAFVLALLARHPGLEGIVLDLPHAGPGARAAAVARGLDDRFTAVPGDLFSEIPRGDLLLLKYILHDWKDEDCLRILANCRDALHPGGRVVITEIVMDDRPTGIGPLMDLGMLTAAGSRERSLAQFDTLLSRAGLRRVAATPVQPPYVVIEAVPA